jgi:DNA-binding NtrC family response regulator
MTDDLLISLRILLFSGSAEEREVLRRGAATASVPVELVEAERTASARAKITFDAIDVVFADASIPAVERAAFIAQARSKEEKPFVFLVAATVEEARAFSSEGADSVVMKPANADEAQALIERCARLRLPNRVLVVDDSLTMRSIVRKILLASRFRLELFEAQEGADALRQIASGKFDLVFLDYNMPGLSGVETLAEIKRQCPDLHVVIMTSAADGDVAERARRAGAAAFLKKPFYPADIDAVLHRIFGLQAISDGCA